MTTFSAECSQMLTEVRDTFGVNVTLTKVEPGAITDKTMVRAETLTSITAKAVKRPIAQDRLAGGEGRTLREEAVFEFIASDVTNGTPAPGWRIVEGATTWQVTAAEFDVERLAWTLTARRGA